MNLYSSEVGFYIPSFLYMKVDTKASLEKIFGTPIESVFVHEYVHFLQDISTVFGLVNTSYTAEYFKSMASYIRQNNVQKISAPILPEVLKDHMVENELLFFGYCGDGAFISLDEWEIDFVSDKDEVKVRDKKLQKIVLHMRHKLYDTKKEYNFGAIAIMESLACLIERHIYHDDSCSIDNLPYGAAHHIVKALYREMSDKPWLIAAICEISLMAYHPAGIFLLLITCMKRDNFMPGTALDMFNYAKQIKFEDESSMTDLLVSIADHAKKQIDGIFTSKLIKDGSSWFTHLVDESLKLRNSHPCFLANLLEMSSTLAKKRLLKIIDLVGVPLMFNSDDVLFNLGNTIKKYPGIIYYPAANEIFEIFSSGQQIRCRLNKYCESGPEDMEVDANCLSSPWYRANMCPFAVLWKTWDFSGREVIATKF